MIIPQMCCRVTLEIEVYINQSLRQFRNMAEFAKLSPILIAVCSAAYGGNKVRFGHNLLLFKKHLIWKR